jgi:uncharacterized protein YbcC (UPF0753/DUF2309 family)
MSAVPRSSEGQRRAATSASSAAGVAAERGRPTASLDRHQKVRDALDHAVHLLPAQGPIDTFIHHNTLHAFAHLPFDVALAHAAELLGSESYLPEAEYREAFARGRIDLADLEAALQRKGVESSPMPGSDSGAVQDGSIRDLHVLALLHELEAPPLPALDFMLEEGLADRRFPDDVPVAMRARAVEATQRWLFEGLARVGHDRTFAEVVDAITMADLLIAIAERVRADVSSARRSARRGESRDADGHAGGHALATVAAANWLSTLGLGDTACRHYRGRVAELLADEELETTLVDVWLMHEAQVCRRHVGHELDVAATPRAIEAAARANPEPITVRAMWRACLLATQDLPRELDDEVAAFRASLGGSRAHRDALLALTGTDIAKHVDPVLIRLCAAVLDEGIAAWRMPARTEGLWQLFRRHLERLAADAPGLDGSSLADSPWDAVEAELARLGVAENELDPYLARVLLELPGWAGMIHWRESRVEYRDGAAPRVELVDYLAIRLVLTRAWTEEIARREIGGAARLSELRRLCDERRDEVTMRLRLHAGSLTEEDAVEVRRLLLLPREEREQPLRRLTARPVDHDACARRDAWTLLRIAQLVGLSPVEVDRLTRRNLQRVFAVLRTFSEDTRRAVWQEAYEAHYADQVLGALSARRSHGRPSSPQPVASASQDVLTSAQCLFCIDDREEGFRRHLEERHGDVATYGVAGFFGVAIRYRGHGEVETSALCPLGVTPAHDIVEAPAALADELVERHRRGEAILAHAEAHWRSILGHGPAAFAGTIVVGALAWTRLIAQTLAPGLYTRLVRGTRSWWAPPPRTKLTNTEVFSVGEKADRVAATLENVGLVRGFAPIVMLVGHGSSSLNNPHRSAYDCGACGGRHGGPNARLFASFANDRDVRSALRERGIDIPDTTVFVGAEHDTASEDVAIYDADTLAPAHREAVRQLRAKLDDARLGSAHERCRRLASAPRDPTPARALEHVRTRTVDPSQPRPELGHVTNAAAIVGRRALTQGVFLDRRAFLVSYDPDDDGEGRILERILLAVGPVGSGINLEYYFSRVDPVRLGAGTKLPHNVVGLFGVMDGQRSDLRTGLPRQMIEIHEPMRLLLVIETPIARMRSILERQPVLAGLIGNAWVRVVVVEPETGEFAEFVPGQGFTAWRARPQVAPPVVPSSAAWYRGHHDFLAPAIVAPDAVLGARP